MFYYSFYVSLQKQAKRIYGVIIRLMVTCGEGEIESINKKVEYDSLHPIIVTYI